MIGEIWQSFRRMPKWVQIWVAIVLAPVNMASVFFLGSDPAGPWITGLAWLGMLFNLPIMIRERGLSRAMAFPHILFWTPMVLVLVSALETVGGTFSAYLWLLLIVNLISLTFDFVDARRWLRGDRAIA